MKTIEENANQYGFSVYAGTGISEFRYIAESAFKAGAELTQRWIEISEDNELPDIGDEIIVKNDNRKKILKISSYWDVKDITEWATHWRPIEFNVLLNTPK